MRIALINLFVLFGLFFSLPIPAQNIPSTAEVMEVLTRANGYFMKKYADPTLPTFVGRERPSHIWTRGVYYQGLMGLISVNPREDYYQYALCWAEFHKWNMQRGATGRDANDQAVWYTYAELYRLEPRPERVRHLIMNLDMMTHTTKVDDWTWIDAINMAMPSFARAGNILNRPDYWEKMHQMYACGT